MRAASGRVALWCSGHDSMVLCLLNCTNSLPGASFLERANTVGQSPHNVCRLYSSAYMRVGALPARPPHNRLRLLFLRSSALPFCAPPAFFAGAEVASLPFSAAPAAPSPELAVLLVVSGILAGAALGGLA